MGVLQEIQTAQPDYGQAVFWWLGQMGFAFKLKHALLYIDPFLSPHPDRLVTPPFLPEDIKNADFILGTHDHIDHIDHEAWKKLSISSPQAQFIVPGMLRAYLSDALGIPLSRFIGAEDGARISLGDIAVQGVALAHEFLDRDAKTGQYPYMGYHIKGGGISVFHCGDTCIYEGFIQKLRALGALDALFVPINGRDGWRYRNDFIGNMTYQEAVDLVGALQPALAVPGHYGMFLQNTEDVGLFADYLHAKYPALAHWAGEPFQAVHIAAFSNQS